MLDEKINLQKKYPGNYPKKNGILPGVVGLPDKRIDSDLLYVDFLWSKNNLDEGDSQWI